MGLRDEVQGRRAEFRSDGYPMSIGELVSLYRDGELDVHPEFQRFFRWTRTRKARLIESLLLGIPLPSIFISQRDDGVWDVVDGMQRLSTIFEFMGVLKNEEDECREPLVLVKTQYLPSLENRTWRDDGKHEGIGSENQLIIKRSKIDVKIMLGENGEEGRYELFQRLNMGGSQLSAQELRNALMIMADPTLYGWVAELSRDQHFRKCLAISDRAALEQYDLELVCRFLVLRDREERELEGIPEFGEFLTEALLGLAATGAPERHRHGAAFARTFEILAEALEDDSFRRYDHRRGRHLGGFLIAAFEVVALGLGYHVSKADYRIDFERVRAAARGIWQDATFLKSIGSGVRASSRIPVTIPRGRALFA